MFVWPHGIHVDRDGNVWVADARAASPEELKKFPGEDNKGSVVVKFSPQGKVLMTLGKPGVRGNPPEALTDPTDLVTDPRNGDVYVAESHTDVTAPNLVGRISVFDRNGKFLRSIGKAGTGPGEFRTPHALMFDARGRLWVADRGNHRLEIFDQEGKYLESRYMFGRVSGIFIRGNTVYAIDSESGPLNHTNWRNGVRIGPLDEDRITAFIPPFEREDRVYQGAAGEGVAVDADGNVYAAEGPNSMTQAGGAFTKYSVK